MDWRKFFGSESDDKDRKPRDKFNFKKFDDEDDDEWFDLETFFNEFHENKFRFHGFPNSILKQFKTIIDAMEETEDAGDKHTKEKNLQKFYDNYSQFKKKTDQDLDGKIYVDQLDTLLKRINPELKLKQDEKNDGSQLSVNDVQILRKLTDEEKIMDIIHGTYKEPVIPTKPRKRHLHKAPISPHHFSTLPFHEFPPPSSSTPNNHHHQGRSWGRTVISIRNADGSSETRKVERLPDGNTRTTITKTDTDGNSSTKSFVGEEKKAAINHSTHVISSENHDERNLVDYHGYKIPCLW